MKKLTLLAVTALTLLAGCTSTGSSSNMMREPAAPADDLAIAPEQKQHPAPGEIVAAAKAEEWVAIAPSDLLVMDLSGMPDGKVLKPRRVVIQLIPAPFSQGWVGNIRKLAAAKWWDGTSINRVQDNYVVQWGDATEKKALPEGLALVAESEYAAAIEIRMFSDELVTGYYAHPSMTVYPPFPKNSGLESIYSSKPYAPVEGFADGWPVGATNKVPLRPVINGKNERIWPVHCYGMVGVGRNLSPDTGSGAELYTVIGHAPRHLDRNIALVGRVIEGIEHLSSLPRGTGALGFYETEGERVPIRSMRLGNEVAGLPAFEYLSTESASFAAYADARANRRDPFFNVPAGGADICNIPVPVRRKTK